MMKTITPEKFAKYWGLGVDDLLEGSNEYLHAVNTRYREADKAELEQFIDAFIKMVSKNTATRTQAENFEIFDSSSAGVCPG